MEAEIFTARRCCSMLSVRSLASLTNTAAAPPSQLAEHMGRVLGYEIIMSFMICSNVNRLEYAANGFNTEWA